MTARASCTKCGEYGPVNLRIVDDGTPRRRYVYWCLDHDPGADTATCERCCLPGHDKSRCDQPGQMGPQLRKANSRDVGGCNFCNRNTTEYGEKKHVVYEVSGNSISVRFCERCVASLRTSVEFGVPRT